MSTVRHRLLRRRVLSTPVVKVWGYDRPGEKKCKHCHGQGSMGDGTPCPKCGGSGLIQKAENPALVDDLRQVLGDVVVMSFHTLGYHWNVRGSDFSQYHALFQTIYEDVYSSVDLIAENVVKLGGVAPRQLSEYLTDAALNDTAATSTDPVVMANDLLDDNDALLASLMRAFQTANDANEQGIANFLSERIDMHQKWGWQLRASAGSTGG